MIAKQKNDQIHKIYHWQKFEKERKKLCKLSTRLINNLAITTIEMYKDIIFFIEKNEIIINSLLNSLRLNTQFKFKIIIFITKKIQFCIFFWMDWYGLVVEARSSLKN